VTEKCVRRPFLVCLHLSKDHRENFCRQNVVNLTHYNLSTGTDL